MMLKITTDVLRCAEMHHDRLDFMLIPNTRKITVQIEYLDVKKMISRCGMSALNRVLGSLCCCTE